MGNKLNQDLVHDTFRKVNTAFSYCFKWCQRQRFSWIFIYFLIFVDQYMDSIKYIYKLHYIHIIFYYFFFFSDWQRSNGWKKVGTERRTLGVQLTWSFPLVPAYACWPITRLLWSRPACISGIWRKNENQGGQRKGKMRSLSWLFRLPRSISRNWNVNLKVPCNSFVESASFRRKIGLFWLLYFNIHISSNCPLKYQFNYLLA